MRDVYLDEMMLLLDNGFRKGQGRAFDDAGNPYWYREFKDLKLFLRVEFCANSLFKPKEIPFTLHPDEPVSWIAYHCDENWQRYQFKTCGSRLDEVLKEAFYRASENSRCLMMENAERMVKARQYAEKVMKDE